MGLTSARVQGKRGGCLAASIGPFLSEGGSKTEEKKVKRRRAGGGKVSSVLRRRWRQKEKGREPEGGRAIFR